MATDFEWDLMRSFLAVLREGTLGKAASSLGSSQPSIGRHVKQLEARLGTELFERRAQRMVPTPFAERLGASARAMSDGAEAVRRLLLARSAEATRTVRISASRMTATQLVTPLLAAICARPNAPEIELVADDALTNLAEHDADLAVRHVRPSQESLVVRRVGNIHFGLYGARSYLRQRAAPVRPEDLAQHVVIGFDRSALMVRGAKRIGLPIERGRFRFRSDDRVVHWAAVKAGVGIGLLPTYLGEREEGLVRVLPEQRLTPNPVWLVARRDVLTRPPVKQVYEALRDALIATLTAAEGSAK